jgi:hypothetical protein
MSQSSWGYLPAPLGLVLPSDTPPPTTGLVLKGGGEVEGAVSLQPSLFGKLPVHFPVWVLMLTLGVFPMSEPLNLTLEVLGVHTGFVATPQTVLQSSSQKMKNRIGLF